MKTIKVLASFVALLVAFGATARPPLNQSGVAHLNLGSSLCVGCIPSVSNVDTLAATFSTISGFQFPFFYNFTSVPTIAIAGVTTPYCPGITRNFTVNSNGARPTNYTWSVSPVGSTYTVTGGTINVTFGTATSTTISVTATYPSGSITSSITLTNGKPIVTMATSPVSPCSGTPITVTASSNLPSTYSWSTGVIFAGANATSTINATSGFNTYKVTVNPGNGCTAVGSINTSVAPAPTVTISPATIVICSGDSTILTASGTAGNTYRWSTTATTSSITVTPTTTMLYTVTATGSNGCTATASRTVTVNLTPTANITTVGAHCVGNTNTTFTASGGGTYSWSQGSTTAAIIISNPTNSGTYTVTVTSANGCTATSSRTIDQYSISFYGVQCFYGTPFQINALFDTPNTNPSYTWSFNNNIVSATPAVSILGAGGYDVTVIDNLGCRATGGVGVLLCFVGNTSMLSNESGLMDTGDIDDATALSNLNNTTSFAINPNPTSGSFNLSIKMEEVQEIGIIIRDLTGRVLQKHQLGKVNDSNYLFDLTGFPAGMYLLSVHGEQGQLSVVKLIKE